MLKHLQLRTVGNKELDFVWYKAGFSFLKDLNLNVEILKKVRYQFTIFHKKIIMIFVRFLKNQSKKMKFFRQAVLS